MPGVSKGKILIVDDEPSSLELLEVYLGDKGFDIACAVNGRECIEKVSSFAPQVVILDVRLPDRNGLEILKELKRGKNPPQIIIVTAFHDMGTTIEAIRSGAFEYIPKPIDVDELEDAVARALALSQIQQPREERRAGPARTFQKGEIVGNTREMNEIFKTIGILSQNRVTVLIQGETGTGKELVARAIHSHSSAKDQPFVPINCSAIVENLLESELFGHEKGAFTGAVCAKKGLFENALEGTVFLDEVGELPLELQAKLLRVLQEREFQPVGGEKMRKLKARVVAATNRDLNVMVREGRFREDLFYRLSVATIRIPPLRKRKSDIPMIIEYLATRISTELQTPILRVSSLAVQRMAQYSWPGNVRELENVLTKAAIQTKGDIITDETMSELLPENPYEGENETVRGGSEEPGSEKDRIVQVLNDVQWHYGRACDRLGISRPTLKKRMKDYNILAKPRRKKTH